MRISYHTNIDGIKVNHGPKFAQRINPLHGPMLFLSRSPNVSHQRLAAHTATCSLAAIRRSISRATLWSIAIRVPSKWSYCSPPIVGGRSKLLSHTAHHCMRCHLCGIIVLHLFQAVSVGQPIHNLPAQCLAQRLTTLLLFFYTSLGCVRATSTAICQ